MERCRVMVMCVFDEFGGGFCCDSDVLLSPQGEVVEFLSHKSSIFPTRPCCLPALVSGVEQRGETVYIISYIILYILSSNNQLESAFHSCQPPISGTVSVSQPLAELLGMRFPETHAPLPPSNFVRVKKRMAGRSLVP